MSDPRQCPGCGGDIDPISHDPKHPLHQPRQYGQPADCRGWRQFLVERPCPGPGMDQRTTALPCVIWITTAAPNVLLKCGHRGWRVHPSSAEAVANETGTPLTRPSDSYWACEQQGQPIE